MHRKIIHIDMDAFFASVEQRNNPTLRGKPVIVGGSPEERGVVAAASYEARRYGIRSAMPSATAKKLCPSAIFIKPKFEIYKHISNVIIGIMKEYTDLIEPVALDEAYLDVTENKKNIPFAERIAKEIREKIFKVTNLTASAGVAPNKFLAKIASEQNKPDGMFVIKPEEVEGFIKTLPIRKVPGIGAVTEAKMHKLGINTLLDLRRYTLEELTAIFGRYGSWYYLIARGIDNREVEPYRERKSLGKENTFKRDLIDKGDIEAELKILAGKVAALLEKHRRFAKTITVKITYHDFKKITRSKTLCEHINSEEEIYEVALSLLKKTEASKKPLRLLGISASKLFSGRRKPLSYKRQLDLFNASQIK